MIPDKIRHQLDLLKLKYDIKREYFTVGIPVILALLLVVGAYMSGHTLFDEQGSATEQKSDRQKALEELMKQMAEEEGTSLPTVEEEQSAAPAKTPDLDNYLVFAAIIALTPYSVDRFLQRRQKKRNEEEFSQFLFKMSEMMRAGIDPIKAVVELSKTDLGGIKGHVNLAASTLILGGSFEEGMRKTAKAMNSELASKYIQLVIQASYMGGQVSNLILKASEDMRSMIKIEREMEGNLQQYVMIFYFAQIILIVMIYILSTQLFPFLTGEGMAQLFGGGGLGEINYTQLFFHLLIINGLIGGIIVGKIAEGSAKDGLKHSVVLTVISYLACVFLLFPSVGASALTINIVSGNAQAGMVGMEIDNPIIFQVLDANGDPKSSTVLNISLTPAGKLDKSFYTTDKEGNVSVIVTLGMEEGTYEITAKYEETKAIAKVTASS